MSEKEISSGTRKAESLTRKQTEVTKNSADGQVQTQTAKTAQKQVVAASDAKSGARKTHSAEQKQAKTQNQTQQSDKKAKSFTEMQLEYKQKVLDKIAEMRAKSAERKEQRKARRDELKSKTREQRAEERKQARIAKAQAAEARRQADIAERQAKREHALKVKAEKAKQKRDRTPGFGGWLAAVIALGVSTLALGTMLTFGWINLNGMRDDMTTNAVQSIYELNSIVDNLDANLSKARVATSSGDRAQIFTDIAIESEMAESCIERLPVAGTTTRSMTAFINKMGDSAQGILYTIANGGELSSSQKAAIEYMYKTNKEIKEFLNELTSNLSVNDMMAALKGKGKMFSSFEGMTDLAVEVPKEIYDGPFAETAEKVTAKDLEGLEQIDAERAEELAGQYFKDYGFNTIKCTGEAINGQIDCYNLTMRSDDGESFAQLSKAGGKLVMFDSYKGCTDRKYSVDNCITIAQDFLNSIGYKNMKAVWTSENGACCNLNFAYMQDGAIVYSDLIKVKVCEERGIVTGIEASPYVLNHTTRSIAKPAASAAKIGSKLEGRLEVIGSRLALIPKDGAEVLTYEYYGTYGGNTYYVYLDANTGVEVNIFTVIGTAQGKALM